MKKRILSLLLTLVMVVSLLPLNVIASDLADTGVENVNDAPEANNATEPAQKEDNFVPTPTEQDTVAMIGTAEYKSLQAAIAAAQAGDTIKLLADNAETVTISKVITIDGQGFTLGGTVNLAVPDTDNNETMKFVNVVFKTTNTNGIYLNDTSYNVTFDACTFKGAASYIFEIPAGTSANNFRFVNECVVDTDANFMQILGTASDMSVDGMHIVKCENAFKVNKCGNAINFNGVTVDYAYIFIYGMGYSDMSFNINGCTIHAQFPFVRQDKAVMTYTYTFTGENDIVADPDPTAPVTPTEYDGLYLVQGTNLGSTVVWNAPVPKNYVAQIGETKYETLAAAIAAAQAGDTIKLLADVVLAEALVIPADKTITLDLNNHSIKQEKNQTAAYSMIVNNGALTIMGTGTIAYTDLGNGGEYVSNTIVNNGVLTVNGGTIMNNSSATVATNGYPHAIDNNAELIINGGEIKCDTYTAIRVWCTTDDNTSVTITGGTVSGVNAIDMQNVNAKANKGTMTISGGNVGKIRLLAFGADNDEIHVAISGGNFTDGIVVRNYVGASEADLNAVFAISGGTFTYDPTPYLAADSKVTKLADGTYGVEALTVHEVATKAELDAAIAEAQPGEVIRLTADIDYTGTGTPEINKAIVLDLGGHTLTTHGTYGGLRLKGGCSLKNGTLAHKGTVTAIKAWDVKEISDLVIDVGFKADKVIGGIVIQENAAGINTIKNVTIKGDGLTNGIETYNCGNATAPVIGSMENVTIDAVGTGMNISAPCGTATNCSIKGGVSGIEIWIKGTYSASLDLVDCDVEGGKQAVYAHDEINSNPDIANNGKINLTADVATTFASENGALLTKVIARIAEGQLVLPVVLTNGAVATVGDTYYKTLQAAIDAAQDGETITIIADINLVWDGTTKIGNKYAAISCVAGKAVTIDLNGHKLTGNSETWSNGTQIFAVFAADEGGCLTLKDSVGDASVKVTGTSKMYCLMMAYEPGTKLIVEGGSYSLDNASDSLIYSGGDEIITINGGNFYLGNVGTGSNGSPWLFNASGQNTQNIIVNGGTFNADIIHQYYPFEVMAPKEKALKNNGDGTWTMVDAVAYVEEFEWSSKWYTNYVGYATLEEAIAAAEEARAATSKRPATTAEVVVLLKDAELNAALVIEKAITFDCNGYFIVLKSDEVTLTAPDGLSVKTDVENRKVVYENGTYKLIEVTYAAEVNGVKYETIQAAINAAQNGDVIKIIANIDLVWDGTTKIDGSLPAIACVVGKAVTIDLNGHTLTGNSEAWGGDLAIYAVFAADEGGSLTLKDSVGGASVKVTGASKLYCLMMAYEAGTKLIVEGGNYSLEKAHDSLIFSGGASEIVVINGGNFHLGNVGTGTNGKPWIFNAYGNNNNHVLVNGGTFNADVAHQFWRHEAQFPETKALKNNGNGTWTVVDAEAYIVEDVVGYGYIVGYATVQEALAAAKSGEVVKLVKDSVATIITVINGATLDLNGKTLTATYLVAFDGCSVIDSTMGDGLLEVPANAIMLSKNNSYIPIYQPNVGYKFCRYKIESGLVDSGDSFKAYFRVYLGNETRTATLLGAEGTKLAHSFKLTWTVFEKDENGQIVKDENGQNKTINYEQIFHCGDELVAQVYDDGMALTLTFTDILVDSEITVTAVVVSEAGVVNETVIDTFTKAQG